MTHHNPLTSKDSLDKVAKEAGNINADTALDYREVEQGVNVAPGTNMSATTTMVKSKKGKKESKRDNKKESKPKVKRTIVDEAKCSSCANLMVQSESMNWDPLNAYLPKKYEKPPGAPGAEGKAAAIQCDDCKRGIPRSRDYLTVPAILKENGQVYNIAITDLVATREKEK